MKARERRREVVLISIATATKRIPLPLTQTQGEIKVHNKCSFLLLRSLSHVPSLVFVIYHLHFSIFAQIFRFYTRAVYHLCLQAYSYHYTSAEWVCMCECVSVNSASVEQLSSWMSIKRNHFGYRKYGWLDQCHVKQTVFAFQNAIVCDNTLKENA